MERESERRDRKPRLSIEIANVREEVDRARQEVEIAKTEVAKPNISEARNTLRTALISGFAAIIVGLTATGGTWWSVERQNQAQQCAWASEFVRDETPSPLLSKAQSNRLLNRAIAVLESGDCSDR